MKKFIILITAAMLTAACSMGELEIDPRSADDLFKFTSLMVTKSIEGPLEVICKNQSEEIFAEGYIDTLWSREAGLEFVVKRTPDDSLWMVSPSASDGAYNFYTFVKMLPEGLVGHNDVIVETSGSYTENDYRSDFRTNGDFYYRWVEKSDNYNGLNFSISALPYGKFEAETYLDTKSLDWCKVEYNGQDYSFDTSKGDNLSLER